MTRTSRLLDVVGVWAVFAVATAAVLITYSRLPPAELYHTSVGGLAGGAGRAFVFVNYPVALAAVAVILVCADRLADGRRSVIAAAGAGIILCLVVAAPGVVDPGDLDAKPVNVLPAIGVAIAIAFTFAVRPTGWAPPARGDRLMLAYGLANAVQDAWGEQVVKRGWTTASIPSLIRPDLSLWWGLIVATAVIVWLSWFRPARAR